MLRKILAHCLPVCYKKISRLRYTELLFCLLLCMGVKLVRQIAGGTTLRVLGNRVLRKMFGPKRDEVTGEWRRLHNEQVHDGTPEQTLFG